MLASENSVKCVMQDESVIFTSDVEHLLSSLDIEHTAGELVVQALQSHKHIFGTGTKTLLFMIASLAKAVIQLLKLDIPSEKSLHVINMTLAALSREVENISIMTQGCLNLFNETHCCDNFCKSSASEGSHETVPPQVKSIFNIGHQSSEVICPNLEKNSHMFEESIGDGVIHNLPEGKTEEPLSAAISVSADLVYLKMSNLQDLSENTDDVGWFFDHISSQQTYTAVTKCTHTFDHVNQEAIEVSSTSLNCLLCTKYQDCAEHCFSSADNDTDLTVGEINSSDNILTSSHNYDSGLRSMDCKDHRNDLFSLFSDVGISSLKDNDQHDLDFENCFDETNNKQQFHEAIKAISTDNACSKDKVVLEKNTSSRTSSSNDAFAVLFNNSDKHHLGDITFNEDSQSFSFGSQTSEKDTDGECDVYVSDTDKIDSPITCGNSLLNSGSSSEHPTTHQIFGTLNEQKEECSKFSCSNISCEIPFTETIPSTNPTSSAVTGSKQFTEIFSIPNKKSSEQMTQKSEIEMLNRMLSFHGVDKHHVNVPTSSSYLQCSQNTSMWPTSIKLIEMSSADCTTDVCQSSSINMIEDLQDKSSTENKSKLINDNCSVVMASNKLNLSGNGCDILSSVMSNIESNIQENVAKEYSNKTNSNGTKYPASSSISTGTISEVSDYQTGSLKKQSSNLNNNNKDSKDTKMLLDQLLLQKKKQFQSSLAKKVMTSSRHLHNSCIKTLCQNSSSYEDCKCVQCSLDLTSSDPSKLHSVLLTNVSNSDLDRDEECDNNEKLCVMVQNGIFTTPALSDLKVGNSGKINDLYANTCNLPEKADVLNDFGVSTCCNRDNISNDMSRETEQFCSSMKHEIIAGLHDCHGDIADAAKTIFQNQMKDNKETRFNFHLVDCLSLTSSRSSVSVVQGLVIACDALILERLDVGGKPLVTLLVNADVTPSFHHQGYKPTLSKRTFIGKPLSGSEESDERLWCVNTFDIINQLKVKLVLVKGKISSILLDMCEGAGVLVVTNIHHHTLSVLSHLHRVDMVTYIQLAAKENLCNLCLQPLSATWMDHLDKTVKNNVKHYAVVTNTLDVQTVIVRCSSTMSAQLLEERFWKCLHSIANSQVDGKVLPGEGNTEIWCANRIHFKSASALGSQSYMQSVILEAVADIFQDYYQTVRLHTVHNMEQPTRQKKDIHLTAPSATGFPMTPQTCSLKSNIITPKTEVMLGSETDKKDPMFISSLEYLQNIFSNEAESAMSRLTNYTQQVFPNSELMKPYIPTESQNPNLYNSELKTLHHCYDDQVYDNFQSKISAWMTAVDIVSVLQSLGSLVISGVDSNEITSDMTLL